MTRKQALHSAIEALSANPAHSAAIQTLKSIIDDLPLTHWTESAIEDAVEQYYRDHGRLPQPCEFKKRGLPQRTAIKNTYHMTVGQWLNQMYPSHVVANQENSQTKKPTLMRKKSLLLAVEILSEMPSAKEVIQKLNEILEDLPITRWTDRVIRDSVEQYTLDHGQLPNARRFKDPGMPPPIAITRVYHMTVSEFLEHFYQEKLLNLTDRMAQQKQQQTTLFISEYQRIKPVSREDYDRQRKPGTRCGQTIMVYNNLTSWSSLLLLLNLPKYQARKDTRGSALSVEIFHDFDPTDSIYDSLL